MKKLTTLFLMLCLTLSGALCYASGLARTENEKGKDGISSSGGRFSTMAIAYANYHLGLCFFAREAKNHRQPHRQ